MPLAPIPSYFDSDCEQAGLTAANLDEDAEPTAAVCGQLAGAYYGVEAIPAHWLARLAGRDMIEEMALALARC